MGTDQQDKPDEGDLAFEEVSDDLSDFSWADIPALAIFITLFVLVAAQFFTRYVLNDSLGWTEEISRYFLVMLGFIGGITCMRKESHISLEFVYRFVPGSWVKPMMMANTAVATFFFLYLAVLGLELADRTKANMVSIQLPKSIIYYAVTAGCLAMAMYGLVSLWKLRKKPGDQAVEEAMGNSGKAGVD